MSYDFTVTAPVKPYDGWEWNLTYNLSTMLRRAGFHPNVIDGMTVVNLRPIVRNAWMVLADNPRYFTTLNPPNGWGNYEGAVEFLYKLHKYLEDAPDEYVMEVT